MVELRRNGPYIWITWLSRLLAGQNECEWAAWFKARHEAYSWDKVSRGFDGFSWRVKHSEAVRDCRDRMEQEGYAMSIEGQNHFTLQGSTATLGGRPDLIAQRDNISTIVEVKTGTCRDADRLQAMLYQYAVPLAMPQYRDVKFNGRLLYPYGELEIPPIDDAFIQKVVALVQRVASDTPALRVPSAQECRFCDISAEDCSERVEEAQSGYTVEF